MERREAPGRCATAPLSSPCDRGAERAARTSLRNPLRGARVPQWRACEASPSGRCASRRSTPQASVRSLRKDHEPRCRRPDPCPLAERVMTAPLGEQGRDECRCGFWAVRNFFSRRRAGKAYPREGGGEACPPSSTPTRARAARFSRPTASARNRATRPAPSADAPSGRPRSARCPSRARPTSRVLRSRSPARW